MATKKKTYKIGSFVGHGVSLDGSWDPGCVYKKYTEAALAKPVTHWFNYYMKQSGCKILTDEPKNNINMVKQVAKANKEKCDIYIEWHLDYSGAPSGTIPLYTSVKGRKLATAMNKEVVKVKNVKTRGVYKRNDLYGLNVTDMPAVIFEIGSIKRDLKVIRDNPKAIGKAAAKGACAYLGIKFVG